MLSQLPIHSNVTSGSYRCFTGRGPYARARKISVLSPCFLSELESTLTFPKWLRLHQTRYHKTNIQLNLKNFEETLATLWELQSKLGATSSCRASCSTRTENDTKSRSRVLLIQQTFRGPFSVASKPNFVAEYSFCSIFRDVQDLRSFATLRSQNFSKINRYILIFNFFHSSCKI